MVASAVVIINSSGVISCGSQGDSVSREAPSSPTAGFAGGGATAFPAQAAGKDLRGEHLSDFENKVRAFCSLQWLLQTLLRRRGAAQCADSCSVRALQNPACPELTADDFRRCQYVLPVLEGCVGNTFEARQVLMQ